MADIDLKTETPDTTLPTDGFLFGADSQSAASPSVYPVQSLATTLLGSTTLSGATVTTDAPVLNLSQTWNDAAGTFTGLKFNATDTASAAGSNLLDLQVGGASRFKIQKNGNIDTVGNADMGADTKVRFGTSAITIGGIVDVRSSSLNAFILKNNTASIQFNGNGVSGNAGDLQLRRRAAANLQLGAADAAAPVAQTLSVQGVVAGTTNTAGANLTIAGSQGTGTGAGGSIVFQVAPAGSTGTAQNALVTALTIGPNLNLTLNVPNGGGLNVGVGGGLYQDATSVMRVQSSNELRIETQNMRVFRDAAIGWSSSNTQIFQGSDVTLFRDAADTLAQRRGTNAQTFRVYNTFTSATNFERAKIAWSSNVLQIGTEKGADGGTARALELQTDGTTRLTIATDGAATFSTSVSTPTVTASSTAANTSAIASTGYNLTGSSAVSMVDLAGEWDTTGAPTLIKANITDTASDAASLLMDLQVGGTSKAKIDKDGDVTTTGSVTTAAPAGGTAAAWKLGARVADTTTLDTTQYIEVDVGGTLYKLALVTV
jgi:hypothetical protein